MFQWNNKDGALFGILVTHVDDVVYCGTLNWDKNVVEKLLYIFKTNKKEKGSFRYIGLNRLVKKFMLTKITVSSLKPVELGTERVSQKVEELTIEEKSILRSISVQF